MYECVTFQHSIKNTSQMPVVLPHCSIFMMARDEEKQDTGPSPSPPLPYSLTSSVFSSSSILFHHYPLEVHNVVLISPRLPQENSSCVYVCVCVFVCTNFFQYVTVHNAVFVFCVFVCIKAFKPFVCVFAAKIQNSLQLSSCESGNLPIFETLSYLCVYSVRLCVCLLLPSMMLETVSSLCLRHGCWVLLSLATTHPGGLCVCVGVFTYMCECVPVCDWCSVAQQVSS